MRNVHILYVQTVLLLQPDKLESLSPLCNDFVDDTLIHAVYPIRLQCILVYSSWTSLILVLKRAPDIACLIICHFVVYFCSF